MTITYLAAANTDTKRRHYPPLNLIVIESVPLHQSTAAIYLQATEYNEIHQALTSLYLKTIKRKQQDSSGI
jgi:hypothetical protein